MLMDSLAQYGLTPSILQVLIVAGVVLVIIGMYWKYILSGAAVLFTLFVFASGNTVTATNVPNATILAVKPVESEQQRWYRQFMEDCTSIAENSKKTCDNIWNDRMMDESHLEVNPNVELSNTSYKMKRNKL